MSRTTVAPRLAKEGSAEDVAARGSIPPTKKLKKQQMKKKSKELIREAEEDFGVEGMIWINALVPEDSSSSCDEVEIESETDEYALSESDKKGAPEDEAPEEGVIEAGKEKNDEEKVAAGVDESSEPQAKEPLPIVENDSVDTKEEKSPPAEPLTPRSRGKQKEVEKGRVLTSPPKPRKNISKTTTRGELKRSFVNEDSDECDRVSHSADEIISDLKEEIGDQPWLKNIEQFFQSKIFSGKGKGKPETLKGSKGTVKPKPVPAPTPRKYRIWGKTKTKKPGPEVTEAVKRRGGSIIISPPSQFIQRTHVDFDYDWNVGEDPSREFQLIQKLGAGAFGKVFKAKHRGTGFILAIKTIPMNETNLEEAKKKQKEIEVLKRCRSDYIVSYYGCALRRDNLWVLMECCDRGSMSDLLAILKKPLNEMDISYILRQVLLGLNYLHSIKVIHRDIKSANILLTSRNELKLADFGTSGVVQSEAGMKTTVGTPVFMSPEVLDGEEGYGFEADIWSLGITSIEMADRHPPFHNMSTMKAIKEIVMGKTPDFTEPTKWSDEFRDFLAKCLNRDPKLRPTAEALLKHPFITKTKSQALSDGFLAVCKSLDKKLDPSELSPSGSLIVPGIPSGGGGSPAQPKHAATPKSPEQRRVGREDLINNLGRSKSHISAKDKSVTPGGGVGSEAIGIPAAANSSNSPMIKESPVVSPRKLETSQSMLMDKKRYLAERIKEKNPPPPPPASPRRRLDNNNINNTNNTSLSDSNNRAQIIPDGEPKEIIKKEAEEIPTITEPTDTPSAKSSEEIPGGAKSENDSKIKTSKGSRRKGGSHRKRNSKTNSKLNNSSDEPEAEQLPPQEPPSLSRSRGNALIVDMLHGNNDLRPAVEESDTSNSNNNDEAEESGKEKKAKSPRTKEKDLEKESEESQESERGNNSHIRSSSGRNKKQQLKKGATTTGLPTTSSSRVKKDKERDTAEMTTTELREEVEALKKALSKMKKKRQMDKERIKALQQENKKLKEAKEE